MDIVMPQNVSISSRTNRKLELERNIEIPTKVEYTVLAKNFMTGVI